MKKQIEQIADHFGIDNQLDMLTEECAELIQAINKYKRNTANSYVNLAEEIADVEIMLQQIKYLVGFNPEYLEHVKNRKIDRTIERYIK